MRAWRPQQKEYQNFLEQGAPMSVLAKPFDDLRSMAISSWSTDDVLAGVSEDIDIEESGLTCRGLCQRTSLKSDGQSVRTGAVAEFGEQITVSHCQKCESSFITEAESSGGAHTDQGYQISNTEQRIVVERWLAAPSKSDPCHFIVPTDQVAIRRMRPLQNKVSGQGEYGSPGTLSESAAVGNKLWSRASQTAADTRYTSTGSI
jgi:hypothetical protein